MSAVLVPICGILVDKYGRRASLLVLCALVIAAVHLVLGLTMIYPVIPLIFLGLSYSMYGVAIWPSIATIVQHEEEDYHQRHVLEPDLKLLGTAYGLSTSALNMALTVFPLIAAQVRVWSDSFMMVEIFFASLALSGAVASAILYMVDARNGGVLETPERADEPTDEETTLLDDSHIRKTSNASSLSESSFVNGEGRGRFLGRSNLRNHSIFHTSNRSDDISTGQASSSNGQSPQWLHHGSYTPRFTVDPDEE